MAAPRDRVAFLASSETRLRIAQWCATEALSREEIAERLNRPSGGLSAPNTMARRKALVPAGYTSPSENGRRAELLKLSPSWRAVLRRAEQLRPPGALIAGTDLLLVPLAETEAACQVISAGAPDIDWGMELAGDQLGVLLASRRDGRGQSTIRVAAQLERAGAHPMRLRLNTPMSSAELQSWAKQVISPRPKRSLPRGK